MTRIPRRLNPLIVFLASLPAVITVIVGLAIGDSDARRILLGLGVIVALAFVGGCILVGSNQASDLDRRMDSIELALAEHSALCLGTVPAELERELLHVATRSERSA